MSTQRKVGGVNQFIKGDTILEKGTEATAVGLILKGRVRVQTEGVSVVVGAGQFIGLADLPDVMYQVDYVAETNCAIYIFQAGELQWTVQNIMKANKEYAPLMVTTLSKYIRSLAAVYHKLEETAEEKYQFILDYYQKYQEIGAQLGIETEQVPMVDELTPVMHWNTIDEDAISYYTVCAALKQEVQKAYFGASHIIAVHHVMEQVELIRHLLEQCESDGQYLKNLAGPMIRTEKNLYLATLHLAATAKRTNPSDKEAMELFDGLVDCINEYEEILLENAGIDLQIDHESMENAYFSLMSGGNEQTESTVDLTEEFALVEDNFVSVEELQGSMRRILQFSQLPIDEAEQFASLIEQFAALKDKFSVDDEVRQIRRSIMKLYYKLYLAVFLQDYQSEQQTPLEVDLFLRYGFIDENLLTEELLEELLSFDTYYSGQGDCRVYDMKEWLTEIYEGRKMPSKSEFDMDYEEYLRDQKRIGAMSDEQIKQAAADRDGKLKYEVENMFRVNHRLLGGQASVFVPFLFTEGCTSSLLHSYLSKDKVGASTRRLRQIDYSVFYREVLYKAEESETAFAKEHIMEEVVPDVILLPGCGNTGVMWQELSGRRRNSKGRFLLPQFFEGNLDNTMVRLFGRFRWELCRTMQGATWNNIQFKSLTSEYCDYIQFYRKNRELSEDRKEKIKMQIQKCRNNSREFFVKDYENWINHEAKGGITLNKVARELLATYCPFPKQTREAVLEQPLFRDAMARFVRENGKKNKEYALKFRVWEKDGLDVPVAIVQTRDFYRDM